MGNSGDKMENIIIIGAGPAGISAALYAARGNLTPLLLNNGIGALAKAEKIEKNLIFSAKQVEFIRKKSYQNKN